MIGGTSHTGKSTLAAGWGRELGWPVVSTDSLGRHPGRPWPRAGRAVPPHVAEHYTAHSAEALLAANLDHYRSMWVGVEALVRAHATAPLGRLVLEGSGCWPDLVVSLKLPQVSAVWLTADAGLIARRIRNESGYAAADAEARLLIDRFIARSEGYNSAMIERVEALGLPSVRVGDEERVDDLMARCRDRLRPLG